MKCRTPRRYKNESEITEMLDCSRGERNRQKRRIRQVSDDEARWIVPQIAQKSSASFAGCCVGFCCDEAALDVVALAMTEPLASFSRWMCPNERTSCSAIAASASQVFHRLLVRTQRIGKTRQPPIGTVYSGSRSPGNTFTARDRTSRHKLAGLLPECNSSPNWLKSASVFYRGISWRRQCVCMRHNDCRPLPNQERSDPAS